MSVFKSLTTSDISTTPFRLNKTYEYFSLSEATGSGIDVYIGNNNPPSLFTSGSDLTGFVSPQDSYLVYSSIKHLYFSNFLENMDGSKANLVVYETDGTITGDQQTTNFDNYLSTTLNAHRTFPTGSGEYVAVISIPSNLFGENITPKSLKWESAAGVIVDDGEGRLYYNPSTLNLLVGNIIYEHGIVTLNPNAFDGLNGYGFEAYDFESLPLPQGIYGGVLGLFLYFFTLFKFKSSITLYEMQIKCTIRENEFNLSHNPTLITGSKDGGNLKNFTTESYFSPYVSSVGLHNREGDLLAIAKLSQPLPTSPTTDTNIIVNIDL